jgi:hypothetical protein
VLRAVYVGCIDCIDCIASSRCAVGVVHMADEESQGADVAQLTIAVS